MKLDLGTQELPMPIYTTERDSALTHATFAELPTMVSWFEDHYGDYPFEKVGFVNTPQGAMEHQTMVSFPTALSRTGRPLNLTGAHELAHQWFGNLVSPEDYRHVWLTESFARFSEALWVEQGNDFEGYISAINGHLISYLGISVPSEGVLPLFDFPRESPSSNYPSTIYDKGSVVVGMLRFELGETRFFEAMRSYLDSFAYRTATTEDMRRICEEVSGKDLEYFFDQWVYRAGWPIYDVDVDLGASTGQTVVTLEQVQPDEYGEFEAVSIEIGFLTTNGVINRIVRVDSLVQTFRFNLGEDVQNVLFNQGPNLRDSCPSLTLRSPPLTVAWSLRCHHPFRVRTLGSASESAIIEQIGNTTSSSGMAHLFDSGGRMVVSEAIDSFPHVLNMYELTSGTYLLQVSEGTNVYTFPLQVVR